MSYYVVPPSLGFGDLVVTLPIVQALIARGERVVCCVHSADHLPVAERVPGLHHAVLSQDLDTVSRGPGDVVMNLRAHPLQQDYWWVSRRFAELFPGYGVNEILSHMCRDFGLDLPLDDYRPLRFQLRNEAAGRVLLVPGTEVPAKAWPISHWLALAGNIVGMGGRVLVLGQPQECFAVRELVDEGLPWQESPGLVDALDLLASALAVVAVDTGLMHLAVHQLVPTVAMFRHAPLYLRRVDHLLPVVAEAPCLEECYQLEMRAAGEGVPGDHPERRMEPWSCADQGRGCMASISPRAALAALEQAVVCSGEVGS